MSFGFSQGESQRFQRGVLSGAASCSIVTVLIVAYFFW